MSQRERESFAALRRPQVEAKRAKRKIQDCILGVASITDRITNALLDPAIRDALRTLAEDTP